MAEDRRDDWHNSVDERLVNLNSAQSTTDMELAKIERQLTEIDDILRGDKQNKIDGLIPDNNFLKKEINKFNQIFNKDYLNHGGLVSFITYIHDREKDRQENERESRGYKWGFWGVILAAVIGAAAVILTNKEQIEKWWAHPKLAPLEQTIEKAKHPKGKKIVKVHVITEPPPEEDDNKR